jgi:hypothetical protein
MTVFMGAGRMLRGKSLQMACVREYGRRVSVLDVRVFCACARGERLLGVINIISKIFNDRQTKQLITLAALSHPSSRSTLPAAALTPSTSACASLMSAPTS